MHLNPTLQLHIQEDLCQKWTLRLSKAVPFLRPLRLKLRCESTASAHTLRIEPRVSLLDALREYLGLTGAKKGCNQGACGACTVLVDGERILSCLALAVQYEGTEITTIEGLAADGDVASDAGRVRRARRLPMRLLYAGADLFGDRHDSRNFKKGLPSAVTHDVSAPATEFSDEEIKERMSGNLCRCGAYVGICEAIREAFEPEVAR